MIFFLFHSLSLSHKELEDSYNSKFLTLSLLNSKVHDAVDKMSQIRQFLDRYKKFKCNLELIQFKQLIEMRLKQIKHFEPELNMPKVDLEFICNYQAIQSNGKCVWLELNFVEINLGDLILSFKQLNKTLDILEIVNQSLSSHRFLDQTVVYSIISITHSMDHYSQTKIVVIRAIVVIIIQVIIRLVVRQQLVVHYWMVSHRIVMVWMAIQQLIVSLLQWPI